MDVTEYRQDFLDQVRARASADANFTRAEFVEICAEHLSDAEELADFEACYHRGKGSSNRLMEVDGFAQDEVDGSVRLVLAEYGGGTEPTTLTQTTARGTLLQAPHVLRGRILGAISARH